MPKPNKLPQEIIDMIFNCSSPLTRFLNGRMPSVSQTLANQIWSEALESDCNEDVLRILPAIDHLDIQDVLRIRSKRMLSALVTRFPRSSESNSAFEMADALLSHKPFVEKNRAAMPPSPMTDIADSLPNSGSGSNPTETQPFPSPQTPATPSASFELSLPPEPFLDSENDAFRILKLQPPRLLHAAMRHLWLDVPDLANSINNYPVARTVDAIFYNHPLLLRYISELSAASVASGRPLLVDFNKLPKIPLDIDSDVFIIETPIDHASAKGNLEILTILHESGATNTIEAVQEASANGHLDVVAFLHRNNYSGFTTEALDEAALNGHKDVVEFLILNRASDTLSSSAFRIAASAGHLAILQLLCHHAPHFITSVVLDEAAWGGHMETVQWLTKNYPNPPNGGCTTNAIDGAIRKRHFDVAIYLAAHYGEGFTSDAINHRSTPDHVVSTLMASLNSQMQISNLVHDARQRNRRIALQRLQTFFDLSN